MLLTLPKPLPFHQIIPLPHLSSEQLNIYQPARPTFPVINPPIEVSWGSSRQSHLLLCGDRTEMALSAWPLSGPQGHTHTHTGTFLASRN